MSQQLAVVEKETRLAVPHLEFSSEQIRLLGETVAKGCDQNELGFFLQVCKLKRLDPFSQQVHCVKRYDSDLGREKMTIQVGIDGFRVIAARTGEHAGTTEPEYDTEEGDHPNWARVTVYRYGRGNEKIPYTVTARYREFVVNKRDGNPNRMWATKPWVMLGKCAEAQALRKAFPDELSSLYTDDEMGQADMEASTPEQATRQTVQQPQRASQRQAQTPAQTQSTSQPQTQKATAQNANSGQQKEQSGPAFEDISTVIDEAREGKEGVVWLKTKSGLIVVPADKVDGDMKSGMFIRARCAKKKHDRLGEYLELHSLFELHDMEAEVSTEESHPADAQPVTDAQALSDEAQRIGDEMFGEAEGKQVVQGMVDNGTLKPASQVPSGGGKTIGTKRAQRIYVLCNNNKAANHGFCEAEIKKILAVLPRPLEHLSDLEPGMYEQFEKWATGAEDWRDFWKEEAEGID